MISIVRYIKNNFLPIFICILWFFPVTYFGHWLAPVGTSWLSLLRYPVLGCVLLSLLYAPFAKINWRVLLFCLVTLLSSVNSEDIEYSLAKWAGLTVMVIVFSSFFISRKGRIFRESVWHNFCWALVVIVALSLCWKALGLPGPVLYIKEGFPGITSHAMLFGPLAGLASTFLLSRGITKNNKIYIAGAIICYLAVFSSLSRAAIVAATLGNCAILLLCVRGRRFGKTISLFCLFITLLTVLWYILPSNKLPVGFGKHTAIDAKGFTIKSREILWSTRINEFRENPLLGMGVGVGKGAGRFVREKPDKFSGNLEPGSSYLMVLSMTGVFGALALVLALSFEILLFIKNSSFIPLNRRLELVGAGILLAVHAGAEGWIYSPGNSICLFFWLWFGVLGDSNYLAKMSFNKQILLAKL